MPSNLSGLLHSLLQLAPIRQVRQPFQPFLGQRLTVVSYPVWFQRCYRYASQRFKPFAGSAIALLIIFTWAFSLGLAFAVGAESIGMLGCVLLIPWFTLLYTGLFVTGHDAMHGNIAPQFPRVNRAIGAIALWLYGFIPYNKLYVAHDHHHEFPATQRDPDFHNGRQTHPIFWYFRFMSSYWSWYQTIAIVFAYNGLFRVCGVPEANLLLFWAVPSLLSSVQLFYFGTYLVHRRLGDTYSNPWCSNSTYWPWLISLVTCYHFGYHREHHAFPQVPWWQLPTVKLSPERLAELSSPSHTASHTASHPLNPLDHFSVAELTETTVPAAVAIGVGPRV